MSMLWIYYGEMEHNYISHITLGYGKWATSRPLERKAKWATRKPRARPLETYVKWATSGPLVGHLSQLKWTT